MKHVLLSLALTCPLTTLAHTGPTVPDPMDLDSLTTAFGWDFDAATITTEKVADNLYVLFGLGGNIAVSTGTDGVVIVDDQFPQIMPKIQAAIGELDGVKDGKDIEFAINTHWHFDHAEGNLSLGPPAPGWWPTRTPAR